MAHRVDYDLRQHQEHSRTKLGYFDPETRESYLAARDRAGGRADARRARRCCARRTRSTYRPSGVFLKFHPRMAPIKAGVFPLVAKEGMPEVAQKLYEELRRKYTTQFDVKAAIGKRYARMDEVGTPYCFTIDGDTLKDQTVTVRDRDTASQAAHRDRQGVEVSR